MIYHISIYMDKKNVLLFIPTTIAEGGYSIAFNKPIIVEAPYDNAIVGEKARECLKSSMEEPMQKSKEFVKVYELVTGIKSYSKFSKDRITVTLFMNTEEGFTVLPLVRFADGSYRPDEKRYTDIKLELNATNNQIGEAIIDRLEALKK